MHKLNEYSNVFKLLNRKKTANASWLSVEYRQDFIKALPQ